MNNYKMYLDWEVLSRNNYLFWNEEILEAFSDKLNWDSLSQLSTLHEYESGIEEASGIHWNEKIINKFKFLSMSYIPHT